MPKFFSAKREFFSQKRHVHEHPHVCGIAKWARARHDSYPFVTSPIDTPLTMRTLLLTALLAVPLLVSAVNLPIDNSSAGRPALTGTRAHPSTLFEGAKLVEVENGRVSAGHPTSAHSATARSSNHAASLNPALLTETEPGNYALMLAGLGAMGLIMSRRHRD